LQSEKMRRIFVAAGIATGLAVTFAPEIAAVVGTGVALNSAINN